MNDATPRRKMDHLELCRSNRVAFERTTTLLEDVRLVHCALPELSAEEVDLSTAFMGRRLSAPLLIGAMTGGAEAAGRVNRDLARAAAALGIGMQLGSQRAMLEDPSLADTYAVRDAAPDIVLLGNIGLTQAGRLSDRQAKALVAEVEADGLCLHLNAAMEMYQAEGDRDFRRGLDTVSRFADLFGERLVVKETGCGISRRVGEKLVRAGVRVIDVAGAGGTSWVRIELARASEESPFAEWGIPTAASLCELKGLDCKLIASGGLRTGLDLARAVVLGASMGAAALPFLNAQQKGGADAAAACAERFIRDLRAACLLTGSRSPAELPQADHVITGGLYQWQRARRAGRRDDAG